MKTAGQLDLAGNRPAGADEIDRIVALAPESLTRWQEGIAEHPTPRPELRQWLDLFDAAAADGMRDPPTPQLYSVELATVNFGCRDPYRSRRFRKLLNRTSS